MVKTKKSRWSYLAALGLSVGLALAVGAAVMALAGYDPGSAYGALLRGATGCESIGEFFTAAFTKRQFGNTLEYTMVLCLTGLACGFGRRGWASSTWAARASCTWGPLPRSIVGARLTGGYALAGPAPWPLPGRPLPQGAVYAWIPGGAEGAS